jgi:hypothetical protein
MFVGILFLLKLGFYKKLLSCFVAAILLKVVLNTIAPTP